MCDLHSASSTCVIPFTCATGKRSLPVIVQSIIKIYFVLKTKIRLLIIGEKWKT